MTKGQCGAKLVIFQNNDFFWNSSKYDREKFLQMQLVISLRT